MARRSARPRMQPSLELLENRTLLSTIGVNVKGNSPWAGDATWVDVRHLFLPWGEILGGNYSPDPSLPLTSTGYPLATAGTYANIANYPDGLYQVSYQGTATLSFWGVGQLTTPATLGSDGLYHAVVTVNHLWDPSNPILMMQVSGLNSLNQFGDMHIIMPGYGANPTQEFTNSLLQDLQPFSYIRMVEWNNTINSTQVNWQDRVTPNDFTACGPDGASYEDIVALANESNKDLWINVPAMATNDYIQSLAQLIDQDLNPNLNVYVEYSNETWNSSFNEYSQVLAAADSNPLVTDTSNDGLAVAQQTAFQTRNIGDIFKQVFGSEASRVIPVLGGWAAVPYYNQVALQFLQTNYGAVSNSIADFAIAPYVVLTSGTDVPGLAMAGLFNSMENYLDTDVSSWLTGNESLSTTFGVPVISYEGGQGLYPNNSNNPTLEYQAQNDPGMYTLYKNLIAMWEQDIGTQFTFYALNDSYWGLLPSVTATGSEKWDAVMSSILPAGDANLDGKVTSADIAIVEAHMGDTNAWWEDGDFNHDGVVNAQDLALAEANLPATAAAATFVSEDTNTQGNWQGVYGSDGYNILGNQSSYPVYAAVTTSNVATWVWNSSTSDDRALQDANTTGATDRTAACWYSNGGSFTVDVNLPDGNTHVVSIYADDWDNQGRTERVDVIDPSTGTVLDSRTISSFTGGVYLSWQLTGNVQLRFTALTGPNAVMNGIFFEGAGQFQYDPTGSPWAFSGSSGISGNNSGFTAGNPPAPQGLQVAFLQDTGSFTQNVTGWQAGSYVLSFDAAQRENYQANQQNFNVLIDGAVVGTFTPSSTSYQSYSTAPFTVPAGTLTITFQGLDSAGGDNTAFLNQVAVAPVSTSSIGDPGFEPAVVGDPGFEQQVLVAGQFQYDPTNSPWAFSGFSGISGNNSGFTSGNPPAPQGSQVAFLQDSGSFAQTVYGWQAGSYVLSFDAAQRENYQAHQQNFNVLIDGTVVGTFTPSSTSYETYYTAAFSVTAGAHTISFQGLDSAGGDNTAFLEAVSISWA